MIRLIATDLDDTLLNASGDVTGRTQRALDAAMKAGVWVSLSSGRMTESMLQIAQRTNANAPMILYNGALIYDRRKDETIFSDMIPAALAKEVARAVEDMGIYIQVYPGKGFYCREKTAHTLAYEKSCRVTAQAVGMPVSEWMTGGMLKMLAIAEPETILKAQAALRERFPEGMSFMRSKAHYLEIVRAGVDKGRALTRLGAHLGLQPDEIMAFGDGQNDAALLAAAGTGVAMENAVEECKKAAKLIAPKNTEDGVARVIEQYLAEGKLGGQAW